MPACLQKQPARSQCKHASSLASPFPHEVVQPVGGCERAQTLRKLRVELGIGAPHFLLVHVHVPACYEAYTQACELHAE